MCAVPIGPGWGLFGVCLMRLRGPGCGWWGVVVSAAALLLLAALGLALALILTRESLLHLKSVITITYNTKSMWVSEISDKWENNWLFYLEQTSCQVPIPCFSFLTGLDIKGQAVEDQLLSSSTPDLPNAGDGESHTLPTASSNRSQQDSTATPQLTRIPLSETRKQFKNLAHLLSLIL